MMVSPAIRLASTLPALGLGLGLGLGLAAPACAWAAGDLPAADLVSLDGAWRFSVARSDEERARLERFFAPDFDDRGFASIPVPSNWVMHGFEDPAYDQVPGAAGDGFYRHKFAVPATRKGERALLRFGGVWPSAEVFLNGRAIGRHDSGFTSFAMDVTEALEPGRDNLLAVRVRQRPRELMLDTNDDWSLPGIYRPVSLQFSPRALHLDRIEVVTDLDARFVDATLHLRALVARDESDSRHRPSPRFTLRAILAGMDGKVVARQEVTGVVVGGHNGRDVIMGIPVRAPRLWTAESPNLYSLRVELLREGRGVHTLSERIGFREVSTAGGVLTVNGRPVRLRGVCHHDQHPEVGRATRPEHWRRDLLLMKAANINTVRTSHYAPAEGFVRLADELGMYVIEEVAMGRGGERLGDPSWNGAVLLRAHETVVRDRNRPSVIVWSIGNEDPLTSSHIDVARAIKGLDPTRPTLLPWRAEEDLPPEIDILAPHYPTADELGALAARARRPVIATEYTHALGDHDFGGLEARWRALTAHPAGAGGMIWMWADQGLRVPIKGRPVLDPITDLGKYRTKGNDVVRHPTPVAGGKAGSEVYDTRGVNGWDGIVNPDRSPQRDYWEAKAVYAPVRALDAEVALPRPRSPITLRIANDFDFLDLGTIAIDWRTFVDGKPIEGGRARVAGAPRTTATLTIPSPAGGTGRGGTATTGEPVRYVQLSFKRPDGSELGRQSVRLVSDHTAVSAAGAAAGGASPKPRVTRSADRVIVDAGPTRVELDPAAAGLIALRFEGLPVVTGVRPALWRSLTMSEQVIETRGGKEPERVIDLDRGVARARGFDLREADTFVVATCETEWTVDERNSVAARIAFTVDGGGAVTVEYSLRPRVAATWIPEAGIALAVPPSFTSLRWLGLGPLDSYPNQSAAAALGLWAPEGDERLGAKAVPDWAEVGAGGGAGGRAGFRITGSPYVRWSPGSLRALTAVSGRPTKFARAEKPEHNIDPRNEIAGRFTITPIPGGS